MILATYREDEVERSNHPLKNIKAELQAHNQCAHLRLKLLPQSAVEEYLAARLETEVVPKPLLFTVYHRSEGNPLFMVNITDYLIDGDAIAKENGSIKFLPAGEKDSVPETVQGLIERQVAALSPQDQELLKIAAVAGTTFSVAPIARILEQSRDDTENRYRDLAQRTHFLQETGERIRPSGRGSPRYSFVHALYQNVIYDRVDGARRRRLHQLIGERTEAAYAENTETVAAELATHFERSGDHERAVKYLLQAAQKSFFLCAYAETIDCGMRALALLRSLPVTTDHKTIELNVELLIAVATCASKGYAADETGRAFARARKLSHTISNDTLSFQSLAGIWSYNLLRDNFHSSLKLAQEMLALACRTQNWTYVLNAHLGMGCSLIYLGDISKAHGHLQEVRSQYNLERFRATSHAYGWDPGIAAACYDAMALWLLGYPVQAEHEAQAALGLAPELAGPFHSALANGMLSVYYMYRSDADTTLNVAETALTLSAENGYYHWLAAGKILKGWALVRKGNCKDGINSLTEGIANWESTGAQMLVPTFRILLAGAFLVRGDHAKASGFAAVSIALSKKTHEHYYDAELYRVKGELLLEIAKRNRRSDFAEAEACFKLAIDIARKQKARSLELRAAMALVRLWKSIGKNREARPMLKKIYD